MISQATLGLALALLIPALTWGVSYALLAKHHESWNLWSRPVHESGERTLAGTLFFWNHFLRELPIAAIYGLATLWTVRRVWPDFHLSRSGWWLAVAGLVVLLLFTMVLAARQVGVQQAWADLLQYRDRDAHREWGAHWQMHFLSTVALVALLVLPGILAGSGERELALTVVFLLVVLSAIFRTGRRALLETRWLLHGGREVLTFGVLLWLPLVALAAPRLSIDASSWRAAPVLLVPLAVGVHYLRTLRRSSIVEHAGAPHLPTSYLLANHFFEHFLDLVFIVLIVLVGLGRGS